VRSRQFLHRQLSPNFTWGLAVVALTLIGQWLQSRVHLNHDVSYFVHFAGWLLQGRTLGTDVLDMNLPMVWVIFMPSAALVKLHLMTEPSAVCLVFWCYFLIPGDAPRVLAGKSPSSSVPRLRPGSVLVSASTCLFSSRCHTSLRRSCGCRAGTIWEGPLALPSGFWPASPLPSSRTFSPCRHLLRGCSS
jgi:hypothetical protein